MLRLGGIYCGKSGYFQHIVLHVKLIVKIGFAKSAGSFCMSGPEIK